MQSVQDVGGGSSALQTLFQECLKFLYLEIWLFGIKFEMHHFHLFLR